MQRPANSNEPKVASMDEVLSEVRSRSQGAVYCSAEEHELRHAYMNTGSARNDNHCCRDKNDGRRDVAIDYRAQLQAGADESTGFVIFTALKVLSIYLDLVVT